MMMIGSIYNLFRKSLEQVLQLIDFRWKTAFSFSCAKVCNPLPRLISLGKFTMEHSHQNHSKRLNTF